MKTVKDSMVLINLAKITLLEKSCEYFKTVIIPSNVFEETVMVGKEKAFEDAIIIDELVKKKKIEVKKVMDQTLLRRIHEFNICGGEAEAAALYQQEKADFLISDDDNLRKKKGLLNANIIGSLSILLKLRMKKKINAQKFNDAIEKMRDIGWFSVAVLDKVQMEGEKYG